MSKIDEIYISTWMSAGAPSAISEDLILAEQQHTAQRLSTSQRLLLQLPQLTATVKAGPENSNGWLFPLQGYLQVCAMYFRFSTYSTKEECDVANYAISCCPSVIGNAIENVKWLSRHYLGWNTSNRNIVWTTSFEVNGYSRYHYSKH